MALVLAAALVAALFDPGRCGAADDAIGAARAWSTIRLRVVAHASLDAANLALARETLARLLATAQVRVEWRDDSASGRCAALPGDSPVIPVLLMPYAPAANRTSSGEVVQSGASRTPAIVVYVPRVAEVVQEIHHDAAARAHPGLATVRTGHLVGLAIAHEVGHVLRLPHTPTGIMRPRFDIESVLAFRDGRLAFTPDESARVRRALALAAAGSSHGER